MGWGLRETLFVLVCLEEGSYGDPCTYDDPCSMKIYFLFKTTIDYPYE